MARYRLYSAAIPAAGTVVSDVISGLTEVGDLLAQFVFDFGSGGTSLKAYVQTSLDGGTNWIDLICFAPANTDTIRYFDVNAGASISDNVAATDATLTDNTSVDGIMGDQVRLKLVVVGTYVASSLVVYVETKQGLAGSGAVTVSGGAVALSGPLGQAAKAASIPVSIASDQDPTPSSITAGGLYLALTTANVDPGGVAIPAGAKALIVWFETSTSDTTMIRGRIGFNASATAVATITGTDALLAYTPPVPVEYAVPASATHVHLASSTTNAVVRGAWLF